MEVNTHQHIDQVKLQGIEVTKEESVKYLEENIKNIEIRLKKYTVLINLCLFIREVTAIQITTY